VLLRIIFFLPVPVKMQDSLLTALQGLKADGWFFPAGTVVGLNPWVLHRNTDIFGPDPYVYRPERWLEPKEQVTKMEKFLSPRGPGMDPANLAANLAL
jgi:cytochrome P450